MNKRILSILLALVMVLSAASSLAFADAEPIPRSIDPGLPIDGYEWTIPAGIPLKNVDNDDIMLISEDPDDEMDVTYYEEEEEVEPDPITTLKRSFAFEEKIAKQLKTLSIMIGTSDTDFELDRTPSRLEALVITIRLLGKEEEALAGNYTHPFTDVPEWADKYVGYAYENKLTYGVSETEFGDRETDDVQFLTFLLRALGYSDREGDFEWDFPYGLAEETGVESCLFQLGDEFKRADCASACYYALSANLKDSELTLADKLIEEGVFTGEEYALAQKTLPDYKGMMENFETQYIMWTSSPRYSSQMYDNFCYALIRGDWSFDTSAVLSDDVDWFNAENAKDDFDMTCDWYKDLLKYFKDNGFYNIAAQDGKFIVNTNGVVPAETEADVNEMILDSYKTSCATCLNDLKGTTVDFDAMGMTVIEDVFAINYKNKNGTEFLAIVKVPDELEDEFTAIDFIKEGYPAYEALIGDVKFAELVNISRMEMSQEFYDSYIGYTIAEFEEWGYELYGYVGSNGHYVFDFADFSESFEIEVDQNFFSEFDDLEAFDTALQDCKITKITFTGFADSYYDNFISFYLDGPEDYVPKLGGEEKASVDEINTVVGSKIAKTANAENEKFSVVDNEVAEYIYTIDDTYYSIKASKNLSRSILDRGYDENDEIVTEEDKAITHYYQTELFYSVVVVRDDIKYAFLVYDGDMMWEEFKPLSEAFINSLE